MPPGIVLDPAPPATHPRPDASSALAKVDLPLPGRPTRNTTRGREPPPPDAAADEPPFCCFLLAEPWPPRPAIAAGAAAEEEAPAAVAPVPAPAATAPRPAAIAVEVAAAAPWTAGEALVLAEGCMLVRWLGVPAASGVAVGAGATGPSTR